MFSACIINTDPNISAILALIGLRKSLPSEQEKSSSMYFRLKISLDYMHKIQDHNASEMKMYQSVYNCHLEYFSE